MRTHKQLRAFPRPLLIAGTAEDKSARADARKVAHFAKGISHVLVHGMTLGTILLLSCSQLRTAQTMKQLSSTVIGVSIPISGTPSFYQQLVAGIEKHASSYRMTTEKKQAHDVAEQQRQLEDLIGDRVAAIILTPYDSVAVDPALAEANAAGIPVVTADIASTHEQWRAYNHVESNNSAGGFAAGSLMCKVAGRRGNIAILDEFQVTSVQERVHGFRQALSSRCHEVRIAEDVDAHGDHDQAAREMSLILRSHTGLKGVFAINDETARGALDAINQVRAHTVALISYDGSPPALCAEERGMIYAEITQNPELIGAAAIYYVREAIEHRKAPRWVKKPTGVFTYKNSTKSCQPWTT
jgi:ribose transport system substrate-binding protein